MLVNWCFYGLRPSFCQDMLLEQKEVHFLADMALFCDYLLHWPTPIFVECN